MINLFFSYSHKDEELRNELDKHLSILKRQGVINTWHDRCINAGSDFNNEISSHLKHSNIILLLVSSDFLASDYCYDKEMMHALSLHESKKAVVIPVILRPCDWQETPFGKLLGVPKDGKPVVKHPTYDEAFLEITNEIKKVAKTISASDKVDHPKFQQTSNLLDPAVRSSNLRIKKQFSDHEKDQFLDEAFEYMARFFEGSLQELATRNPNIQYRYKRIDSETFTASVYMQGVAKAECTIFYGGNIFGHSKSINFSHSITHSKNSLNESLSIGDDGYSLFLKPLGFSIMSSQKGEMLTYEGASEHFWELFISRLQQ
jgi:hypothetical protein